MKVALFGIYPPPYGGISIHLKRTKLLLEQRSDKVIIFNEGSYNDIENEVVSINFKKIILKIPFIKNDILHFHNIGKKIRMILGFYKLFNKKIILTIHGESLKDQLGNSNFLERKILVESLKKLDKIICVNPKTIKELINKGIAKDRLVHIPAYINPVENSKDFENIPSKIWNFIEKSEFLISANGAIRFYNDEDLYGLDMLIESMKRLEIRQKNINLLFCVLSVETQSMEEKKYYKKLKERIVKLGLEDKIMLYEVKDTEFYPILKKSNLFVRPTNTDGDAVSIREALYYTVPVVTSDIVIRPEGTVLFKTRDIDDLMKKINRVIDNYPEEKEKVRKIEVKDYFGELYKIYEDLGRRN